MKKMILGLALLLAMAGCFGCQRIDPKVQAQASVAGQKPSPEKDAKPVYLCGAPTKAGGTCKRHVKAAGLHCFMHQGAK